MTYNKLLYHVENKVATITLNAPDKLNALDAVMASELPSLIEELGRDNHVRAVVLKGAGKAFCAGGDVSTFSQYDLEGGISLTKKGHALISAFSDLPKPIIASVHGYAIGAGLSLTLLSDIAIASEKAIFGAAFVNIGLVPDVGGLYYLPRLIGMKKTKELIYTGKNIGAQEALRMGLVNTVVQDEELDAAVQKISRMLANQSPVAISAAKRILNMSMDLSLNELLEIEALTQGVCMQSDDAKEAVDAFMNKRKPVFK